ncbi:hypothetical protein F4803DRAFT_567636 [Xylaria telfairii]|nr:hypothetical protein F4803DRAFT_567636 [Xylaria telfairii]
MGQYILFLLGTLLVTQLSLAGVLAAPRRTYIAKPEDNIIVGDNFKDPESSSFHSAMFVTKVVTAEPAMVTVTITAIETTIVNTLNGTINATSTQRTATDGQQTITYNAKPGTDTDISTSMKPLFINSTAPLHHAGSTSSLPQIINTDSSVMASAAITAMGPLLSPSTTFDGVVCDDIFCNTDGNKICIYWAGMTSWDVSRGPIPGVRPTIIGTC